MTTLPDKQRDELCGAIRATESEWYRAYELRQDGVTGGELATAFDLKHPAQPRGWAKAVGMLLGTSTAQIGDFRKADYYLRILCDRLLDGGQLADDLVAYVSDIRSRAQVAYDSREYDNPAIRARATFRARQAEAETEAELDEEVADDVATAKAYQVYAWTYSGVPTTKAGVVVKIGYAGTGPTSDAWRRMTEASRTTGSPGAPTMLRVWEGTGGIEAAKHDEAALQRASGGRIIGGGNEWFTASLDVLDARAADLHLKRNFAVNPA